MIHTELVQMTPELARELLANMIANRTVSNAVVAAYAESMSAGRWDVNGQPIVVLDDGRLGDGQHRLKAVEKSGVTVPMLVVRGVAEGAVDTIDRGRPRAIGDVLGMRYQIANGRNAAAMARVLLWLDGQDDTMAKATAQHKVIDCARANRELIQYGLHATSGRFQPGIPTGSAITGGCIAWARVLSPERMDEFVNALRTGENLTSNSPAAQLRLTLGNVGGREGSSSKDGNLALKTLRAIEAWMAEDTLGVLRADIKTLKRMRDRVAAARAKETGL